MVVMAEPSREPFPDPVAATLSGKGSHLTGRPFLSGLGHLIQSRNGLVNLIYSMRSIITYYGQEIGTGCCDAQLFPEARCGEICG